VFDWTPARCGTNLPSHNDSSGKGFGLQLYSNSHGASSRSCGLLRGVLGLHAPLGYTTYSQGPIRMHRKRSCSRQQVSKNRRTGLFQRARTAIADVTRPDTLRGAPEGDLQGSLSRRDSNLLP
jgi:hypothetical protein